jgi:hypothetical protein
MSPASLIPRLSGMRVMRDRGADSWHLEGAARLMRLLIRSMAR